MEGTMAEIRGFGGNFAPRNWGYCNGSLIAISQNSALFSLIGTIYGGDGRTTFALPDLRGRVPVNQGQGPGLVNLRQGMRGGVESLNLTTLTMPAHRHGITIHARREQGTVFNPSGAVLAADTGALVYSTSAPDVQMSAQTFTVANSGSGLSFPSRNPYTGINMVICMFGIYPSRN